MRHHPLSMSNWVKWELCPCATPTTGGGGSADADSGTRSHAYLSWLILDGEGEPGIEGLTADERIRAEWAFDALVNIADSTEIHSEERVKILNTLPEVGGTRLVGISGICDAWFLRDGILHVFDYKTYSMGDTDYTAQIGGYALALASMMADEPDNVRAARLYTLNGGSRTVDKSDEIEIAAIAERVKTIIDVHAEKGDDLELACCNKFCKYCGRVNTCPAADRALSVVRSGSVFASLSLAKQMVIVKEVKSICERVEGEVKAELDRLVVAAGGDVSRATLSDGDVAWRYKERAGAGVLDDIAALAEAVAEKGVSPTELMKVCKVAKGAVSDKLLECNPGMKASEAKKIIAPFYKPGKPSRVLERVQ